MEKSEALRIIWALVVGLNPYSVEPCELESILRHPQTIRALEEAVAALHSEVEREAGKRSFPPNAGKPWFPPEEELLCVEFDRGMGVREIARVHGRTREGITARLEALGKVPCQTAMEFSFLSGETGGAETSPSQGSALEEVVKQDLAVDPYRPWLPEEDARICREFYRNVDLGQIGRCLGRNRLAVYSRLVSLGRIKRKEQSSAA
jgi:hypothetical protein